MKALYPIVGCFLLTGCLINNPSHIANYDGGDGGPLIPQPVFPTDCLSQETEEDEDEENCLLLDIVAPVIQHL
ncbi:MAG: hypothetical protein QF872_05385 [Gammaproteobacteria bacterium]|nr:hypothetical protein [Gammaproteobacteria bacterium]